MLLFRRKILSALSAAVVFCIIYSFLSHWALGLYAALFVFPCQLIYHLTAEDPHFKDRRE